VQPDTGPRGQLSQYGHRRGNRDTGAALKVAVVRRFDDRLALACGCFMFGDQILPVEDADRAGVERFAHGYGCCGVDMRHRIAVAAVAEHAVLGHLAMADVAGVVRRLAVQRRQPLVGKARLRDLARGRVDPAVGLAAPRERLPVQLLERIELDPGPEVALDETDRRLDLALRLRPIRTANPRNEAVIASEVQHLRMKAGLPVDPVHDHRLHVVRQHRLRHPAEELERMHHAVQQRLRILPLGELDIPHPRPAQREGKAIKTPSIPVAEMPQSICACSPGAVSKRTNARSWPSLRHGAKTALTCVTPPA
jgi:hypothetical protein